MNELVLATGNQGKIRELESLLLPIQCISQDVFNIQSADETGLSFIENAILKARHASRLANKPALADDSGLVVNALQGKPGIYSARFAGPSASDSDNIDLLLKQMIGLQGDTRKASFYCALALVHFADDPMPLIATGYIEGVIADKRQGEHGFGYDPVFYLPEYRCTMAQLSAEIKNKISHRAHALRQLSQQLNRV